MLKSIPSQLIAQIDGHGHKVITNDRRTPPRPIQRNIKKLNAHDALVSEIDDDVKNGIRRKVHVSYFAKDGIKNWIMEDPLWHHLSSGKAEQEQTIFSY